MLGLGLLLRFSAPWVWLKGWFGTALLYTCVKLKVWFGTELLNICAECMVRFRTVRRIEGWTQGVELQYTRHHNQCCLPSNTSGEIKVWFGKAFLNTCAELKILWSRCWCSTPGVACFVLLDTNDELEGFVPQKPQWWNHGLVWFPSPWLQRWTQGFVRFPSPRGHQRWTQFLLSFVPFQNSDEFKVGLRHSSLPRQVAKCGLTMFYTSDRISYTLLYW